MPRIAFLLFTSACITDTTVVDGRTYQIWGDDLGRLQQMRVAASTAPDTCRFWNVQAHQLEAPVGDVNVLGASVGRAYASESLVAFVRHEQRAACDVTDARRTKPE